jgi:beta-aspartyl-peptidase (threonine type)
MIAFTWAMDQRNARAMYGLAIHGGAGTLPRAEMSADQELRYRAGLAAALDAGYAVLEAGGTSLDAVSTAVVLLEDNPLFNAGYGAVFTLEGHNELDASIMEGRTLQAGAICGVTRIKNPVKLARAVMEQSDFVLLSGTGAEEFAATCGFDFVPQSYFFTDARWRQLERIRSGDTSLSALTIAHVGTVGAVALDQRGDLAAATSTGGMTGKRYRRIGDSPLIGAGTYADNRSCAVSATGHGEVFIRAAVAHDIGARMRYGNSTLAEAVREVVLGVLPAMNGEGGVISIDARGEIVMEFNAEGMFRASRKAGGETEVHIYRS